MWTFGTLGTDSVGYTSSVAIAQNTTFLITEWVRPTASASGRRLWGVGGIGSLRLDADTTAVRLVLDTNTVDGEYTSPTGVLAENTYAFVATLISLSTGTATVKMWSGNGSTLAERTVTTAVSPTGTFNAASATFTVANSNASNVLGCDAGGFIVIGEDDTTTSVIGVLTKGTITQAEADSVLSRLVIPAWQGDIAQLIQNAPPKVTSSTTWNGFQLAASMDDGNLTGSRLIAVRGALARPTAGTIAGSPAVSTRRIIRTFKNRREPYMEVSGGRPRILQGS